MCATTDNKLSLVLPADGLQRDMLGHQARIQSTGVSSDDSMAVSADENGQVSIWELNEAREIWRRFFPRAPGRKVAFAKGDRSLLITGNGVDIVDQRRSLQSRLRPSPRERSPRRSASISSTPVVDCKLVDANEKDGALKLWVPQRHDLYPGRATNMPRVLLDVDGDFTAEVRVRGTMIAARGQELPDMQMSYRAGCLVVWHDDGSYVRFDRGGRTKSTGQQKLLHELSTFPRWQATGLSATRVQG